MAYSKDYFDLQLKFAQKIAQITDRELPEILLTNTAFYKLFGIPGWTFDVRNQTWQSYLQKLKSNPVETSYQFYKDHSDQPADVHPEFGCFSYGVESDEGGEYIEIHFRNADDSKFGPLSKERVKVRLSELKAMFTEIKAKYPDIHAVFGFSWLHNLDSYRRLFPPEFYKNPKKVSDWFKSTALWGQFLDSDGEVKKDLADRFLACVKTQNSLPELKGCFPYQILEPEGKLIDFYRFYGV